MTNEVRELRERLRVLARAMRKVVPVARQPQRLKLTIERAEQTLAASIAGKNPDHLKRLIDYFNRYV